MKKLYFLLLTLLITSLSSGQVINEVDADTPGTDMAEYIEILWTPNTALDGLVVVLFNGSNDTSYAAYDLDGKTTDANGFFILGGTAVISGSDIDMGASNTIQNGADAVGIYTGNDTDFPNGTAVTATNLLSGVVYDTNDNDAAGLLAAIGGIQYNEDENVAKDTQSVQRKTDGTYEVKNITFRADNNAATCDLGLTTTSALCDAFTVNPDTYTATVDFVGGGTSTYTVSADSGTVDLSGGDPSVDSTGTITVTGVIEGTDVTVTVQDGVLCDLMSMITSPTCEPSNTLPIYEGFDYAVAADLGAQPNWNNYSGSGNPIDVLSGSLSYPDLEASTGNSVQLDGSAGSNIDSEIVFTPVTSGEVFASFIINISDLSNITDLNDGGYFAVLIGNGFNARLWVHPDTDPVGTTYDIALTNGSSGSNFTTTKYNVGENVFIVMSYNIDTGVLNGWVNPAGTDLGGSAPAVLLTDTDGSPDSMIDRFALRQDSGGETPVMAFDELRIGTTWADVTPNTLSVNQFEANNFSIYPNPVSNGKVTIASTNNDVINVTVFDILGKQVKNETLINNILDVSNLNTGIYIMKISQNNASVTKKLVIR